MEKKLIQLAETVANKILHNPTLALKRNNERLVKAAQDRLLALQLTPEFIADLERERRVQQRVIFRSPQSGVIDNLNIREGFYVLPGTTLMSVGALDDVWVEAEVFERQAAQVRVGQAVTMRLDYLPAREWRGRGGYIFPSMGVLALGEGRFKSIAVSLGRMDEQSVEVLEGLQEGDSVVVSAQFLLDSESSKSSDFMRMHHEPAASQHMNQQHHHQHGVDAS